MGKTWDSFVPGPELWREVYRVLKPGGHTLCFAGSRTDDLMGIALRLAGFEIRDKIMWIYGTGFPKSLNVAKAIDKETGVSGSYGAPKSAAHAGWIDRGRMRGDDNEEGWQRPWMDDPEQVDKNARLYIGGSDAAKQWDGWGTALKPAFEPIIVARKPLDEKTVAANVLKHGVGGINVDACRVPANGRPMIVSLSEASKNTFGNGLNGSRASGSTDLGRFPANVIHDGSDEVERAFAAFGDKKSCMSPSSAKSPGAILGGSRTQGNLPMDEGTASRFFYSAKANKTDRANSKHPTVKPVALMRYLTKLVTPPGGVTLDPFAGSGTTGVAAIAEGFNVILMERETEYQEDIERRFSKEKNITFTKEAAVKPAATPEPFYEDDE